MPLCLLLWQCDGLCLQEPVSFPAGGHWPFKAYGGDTARLGRDSDHRCQVVKLKILSDVDAQAAGARQCLLRKGEGRLWNASVLVEEGQRAVRLGGVTLGA